MTRLYRLKIGVGILCLEVIPSEETVEGIKILAFGHEEFLPGLFYSLELENVEQQSDFIKVKIAHGQGYKLVIMNIVK